MRLLPLLASLSLGCATYHLRAGDFPPSVDVESFHVESLTLDRSVLTARFVVRNPTDVPAQLLGLKYELYQRGVRYSSGVHTLTESLLPGGVRTVDVRLPLAVRAEEDEEEKTAAKLALVGAITARFEGVERALPFTGTDAQR